MMTEREERSFMPDMVAMFGNSSFQLPARLSNIRRVTIIARNFVNDITFRCEGTSVFLNFYVFAHFVGAMEGYPDIAFISI